MNKHEPRLIRLPEVTHLTGLKKTAIYQRINNSEFPKPVPIGLRGVRWVEAEVQEWIAQRIGARAQ